MPERFELEYNDSNNEKKRPVMLHRVIYGSIERFIGILLEHTDGRLPTWLAPVQVKVLNFTDRSLDYAKKIVESLEREIPELRIETDFEQKTVQSKVKDSEIQRVPYIIVLGDKEEKEKSVAVRQNGKVENYKLKDFIEKLKSEINERK
jgi:threonyl-tRNA synthetase